MTPANANAHVHPTLANALAGIGALNLPTTRPSAKPETVDDRAEQIAARVNDLTAPLAKVETSTMRAAKTLYRAAISPVVVPDCIGNQCLDATVEHVADAIDESGTDWLDVGSRCEGETGELFRAVSRLVRSLVIDQIDAIDRSATRDSDRKAVRQLIERAVDNARH